MDRDSIMSVFVILGLLVCTEIQGSSAVTHVFVKKGEDVLLDDIKADDLKDFFVIDWDFKKTEILIRFPMGTDPIIFSDYTGRLEFPVKNYSVTLKNLQHTDSGVYTARVIGFQGEQTLAEYNVTVQDSESLSPGISVCQVKIVVFSVGLIIMVSAVITVHLMEKLKKNK